MLFPTVASEVQKVIHAIKDKTSAECGYKYSHFYDSEKKMMKKIHFRSVHEITCDKCSNRIKNLH
ncbi:hypothetical protein [Bacillus sp. AK031]